MVGIVSLVQKFTTAYLGYTADCSQFAWWWGTTDRKAELMSETLWHHDVISIISFITEIIFATFKYVVIFCCKAFAFKNPIHHLVDIPTVDQITQSPVALLLNRIFYLLTSSGITWNTVSKIQEMTFMAFSPLNHICVILTQPDIFTWICTETCTFLKKYQIGNVGLIY